MRELGLRGSSDLRRSVEVTRIIRMSFASQTKKIAEFLCLGRVCGEEKVKRDLSCTVGIDSAGTRKRRKNGADCVSRARAAWRSSDDASGAKRQSAAPPRGRSPRRGRRGVHGLGPSHGCGRIRRWGRSPPAVSNQRQLPIGRHSPQFRPPSGTFLIRKHIAVNFRLER